MSDSTHKECSPSQVERIILCPGSRRLMRGFKQKTSSYAEEGTMLHEVMEECIRLDIPAIESFPELTKEQESVIHDCEDYFNSLYAKTSDIDVVFLKVEDETDISWYGLGEVGGTVDVSLRYENTLHVFDWKFGAGIPVSPENNVQLMAYAAGSFVSKEEMLACEEIHLHIGQPRLDSFTEWVITGEELYEWMENTLKPAILRSREPDAPCIPGKKQCRWCVGTTCRARAEHVKKVASKVFEPYSKGEKSASDFIELEELGDLLDMAKTVDKFLKELKGDILEQCMSDKGYPGYKAVAGRSNRKWVDESKVVDYFLNVNTSQLCPYTTNIISPAQAEKLDKDLKKDETFKALWEKAPGKPVLAKEDDKRDAVTGSASEVFKNFAV